MPKGEYILHSVDGELYHYGVKGMKWRIRKRDSAGNELRTNSSGERVNYGYENKLRQEHIESVDSYRDMVAADKAKKAADSSAKSASTKLSAFLNTGSLKAAAGAVKDAISSAGNTVLSTIRTAKINVKANLTPGTVNAGTQYGGKIDKSLH